MQLIGAHVSAAGGIEKAVERAAAIGCNAVQVFSGSPRVWQRPKLESIDQNKVFSKMSELSVKSIITHSLYLVNLASENPDLVRKSSEAIAFDLQFDSHLKGVGVVVHLGSHQGRGWEAVKESVLRAISEILAATLSDSHFLIENAAGQKGKIGGQLEEIKWLIDNLQSSRVGWCFDTCHSFAAGYALNPSAQNSAIQKMQEFQLHQSLACIHVNDSRDPFQSGRDRHANLGEGEIATEDLRAFLHHEIVKDKLLILEVPGENKGGPDAVNVERLKQLVA